ncbi:HAD hydrolase family protein [Streptococcus oralis]|nr:HAD hydrolase superfamily protein [Streptococcus oralis subsp. tigurinus AZ_3a]
MKFVFDLDGTLSFDYMTIDEEIQQVLLKAEDYGHELVFASARSYRDCLGLLGPELSQRLVIGLNGGVAYHLGKAIFERNLDARVYHALVDYCQTYNLPFFADDCFDYSGQIVKKIPFFSSVDPLKVARHQKLEGLGTPIKVVVYMGDHEDLLDDLLGQLERLGQAHLSYHEHEKCLYVNPLDTHKATTVEKLCGENFIAFGNDQNDIELFKTSLYSVQIGDFAGLTPYADDTLELKGEPSSAVAAKILQTFAEFKGK